MKAAALDNDNKLYKVRVDLEEIIVISLTCHDRHVFLIVFIVDVYMHSILQPTIRCCC